MKRPLILCVLVLLQCALTASAQNFLNMRDYLDRIQQSADSVLALNKRTSVDSFENSLKEAGSFPMRLAHADKKKRSSTAVYREASKAMVTIAKAYLCANCKNNHVVTAASGYIISDDGLVVTNHHVAKALTQADNEGDKLLAIIVKLQDGRAFVAKEVVGASEMDDLAILRLDTDNQKFPYLRLAEGAEVGDEVYMIGNPVDLPYYFSKGIVNAKYYYPETQHYQRTKPYQMLISADYAAGASGAPILDAYGHVVGTVSSTGAVKYPVGDELQMILKITAPVERLREIVKMKK